MIPSLGNPDYSLDMSPADSKKTRDPGQPGWFRTTHWSVVLQAGQVSSKTSNEALSILCETYWRPLYAYVRNRGYPEEEAKDLTQGFFTRFLEKNYLQNVDRERGRFRSFLLASMKHFLADEWDKATAQKRGGGKIPLSLDFALAEGWISVEPAHDQTPERIYEKQWAVALLERVLEILEQDYIDSDRSPLFTQLKPLLVGEGKGKSYREIGKELDIPEGSVKVAAHRLKKKYREALRAEIAQTVENIEDIEEEMRYLLTVL